MNHHDGERLDPRDPVKVLLITGWGRSGSTILSNVLGEIDGFFSAGELHNLWIRGLIRGLLCGCTRPVVECDVWKSVLSSTSFTSAIQGLDAESVVALQREAVNRWTLHRVLRAEPRRPSGWGALDDYRRVLNGTYRAISEVTGARVIVDSSKRPINAAILRLLDDVDPYVVQLVRDPRGVAYSRRRHKAAFGHQMRQIGPIKSTIRWLYRNQASHIVRRKYPQERSLLVRYEDFVSHPKATIQAILHLVGEEPRSLPFTGEHIVSLHPNHVVSGNQDRYRSGSIEIRHDSEWVSRQRMVDRLAATTVALPLLYQYGYRVRVARNQRTLHDGSHAEASGPRTAAIKRSER